MTTRAISSQGSKGNGAALPCPLKDHAGKEVIEDLPAYGACVELGQHADRRSATGFGLPTICIRILAVELCERLAFYTFTGTQEFYLEHAGYSLAEAGSLNAAMGTLCMAWALLAGWVADVCLGRYRTIVLFGLLYAVGSLISTFAAWPGINSSRAYLTGVMLLVPMGTAGIKANISNFGADQYDTSDPGQKAAQENFFNWFYLSINLGSAVAYGYLTTLGSNGGLGLPKKYGYFTVYAIASLCMLIAVATFTSGRQQYRMQPVQQRSALGGVACYVWSAATRGSCEAASLCTGAVLIVCGIVLSVTQAIMPQAAFSSVLMYGAFTCACSGCLGVILPSLNPTWLGEMQLDGETLSARDVKDFLRLLPVIFTGNLAFSALYNSMQFWYQQQACQMDLRMPFATGDAQLAGSFFMIADCLAIVLATPIAVDIVNPRLEKAFGARFSHGFKYGLGMAFGVMSVCVAGSVERLRKRAPIIDLDSNCAPEGIRMSAMSATWMVVPFFLMGIGEIYTQPVLMHFAYTKSPLSMRTLTCVVSLVVAAVSNALFTVQIAAMSPWVPNDLNKGHLEYGYYINVILGMVLFKAFLDCLKHHGS